MISPEDPPLAAPPRMPQAEVTMLEAMDTHA